MQIALQNSKLTLLLPKGYERVENGVSLYPEMYQRRKAEDVEMFQSMSSSSYGNIVITHIDPADSMRFGDKGLLINDIHSHLTDDQGLIEVETGTSPRGYEYIYSIIKTYHQDKLNVNYCLRMNIKNGDEVIIDFTGKKDDVAFDGGSAKDYRLRLGSGSFIPGFEDGIIGHESGDKFDLKLTFPKDYGNADLAGAKTVFEILVKQVNEVVKPAIDDELAKKSGAFETLKELREDIKKNLLAQAEHNAEEHFKDDLLTALVDSSKTEAPASLVEEQADHIKEDLARNLETRGQKMEDFLAARQQTQEEWEEEVKKTATRRVESSIIVQKLSDELKIDVTDDEINQQVAEMLAVYKNDKNAAEQLATPEARNSIANRLRINKTMDKLAEINRPNAKPSKKADAKKPAAKKADKKADKKAKK